ncbi:MAG: C40 family peptidase [Betaproteobacteria bacterium]
MQRLLNLFVLAAALGLSVFAQAAEPAKTGDETTFFERYTNAAQDVILKGLQLVGISYRRGGNDEDSGLDCSGFVRLVFKDTLGMLLPRSAREMSEVGQRIDAKDLKPGDLVFFNTMKRAFSHVGIYLGDNYFLHSPKPGAEVRVESMQSSYWVKRYNGARRVIEK